jgi:hypothetical protein
MRTLIDSYSDLRDPGIKRFLSKVMESVAPESITQVYELDLLIAALTQRARANLADTTRNGPPFEFLGLVGGCAFA